uniref:Uncharacterized protein n=1 Tax=Corvus moneduloides TaxID=1196302 RepID=A0A8U7NNJ4_CORMO
ITWSLPDGSRISGFHSEECFCREGTEDTVCLGYKYLPRTWPASPGRWCCWQCTRTRSARTRAPSAREGNAVRGRAPSPQRDSTNSTSRQPCRTGGITSPEGTAATSPAPGWVFSSPVCHQSPPAPLIHENTKPWTPLSLLVLLPQPGSSEAPTLSSHF